MTVFHQRRNALLAEVDCDAYLVVDLARLMPKEIDHTSLYYLTGYHGEGVLIITEEESLLLADERYFEAAKDAVGHDLVIHQAAGDYLANIKDEVGRLSPSTLSFTSNRITYSLFDRLQQLLDIDLTPREDPIAKLRMRKDAEEIRCIDAAVDISESCLRQLVEEIEIGMTEKAIASRLDILMLEAGAGCAFETIVAAGENCFNQHHQPSDRHIKAEDFLLIDFGATSGEYLADITRTFAVGTITPRMRAIHDAASEATEIGTEALRPGTPIKDVWQTIKNHFDRTEFAPHGEISGHCIGLDVHERPFILADDDFELQPGMVTTMEPGIYIQGYGGVRIEDDVLITPDGPRSLTSFPRELIVVG
ncbi:MAG: aminopeptidase P family protein [Candidatus Aminicenantes bacterium]|nr:MAG: aminopeptidase P family protein [Candidatus Aminicenantes bacterium]